MDPPTPKWPTSQQAGGSSSSSSGPYAKAAQPKAPNWRDFQGHQGWLQEAANRRRDRQLELTAVRHAQHAAAEAPVAVPGSVARLQQLEHNVRTTNDSLRHVHFVLGRPVVVLRTNKVVCAKTCCFAFDVLRLSLKLIRGVVILSRLHVSK